MWTEKTNQEAFVRQIRGTKTTKKALDEMSEKN